MIYEKKDWPPEATWCREIPFSSQQWSDPGPDGDREIVIHAEDHGIEIGPEHMIPSFQVRGRCSSGILTKTWGSVGTTAIGNPSEKTFTLQCRDAYDGVFIVWGN